MRSGWATPAGRCPAGRCPAGRPCWPGLPGLARLAGVRKLAAGILQARGRRRQVAVHLHPVVRARQRLTEPVERLLGTGAVALRQARDRVPQGLARGAIGLACLALELRQLPGELVALRLRHLLDLVAQAGQVLLGLLRIPAGVRLGIAGRGPREGSRQRSDRGRLLLVGGVQPRAHVVLDGAQLGEVLLEIARVRAQALGKLAELLGELVAWIGDVRALALQALGDLVDAVGLACGLLAYLLVALDDEVHRVGHEERWGHEQPSEEGDDGGPSGEPGPEEATVHHPQAAHGVAPLAPDEACLGLGHIEGAIHGDRLVIGVRHGPCGSRHLGSEGKG